MTYIQLAYRLDGQVTFLSGGKRYLNVASIDVTRLIENLQELESELMEKELAMEGECDWCDREAITELHDGSPACYEHMRSCDVR